MSLQCLPTWIDDISIRELNKVFMRSCCVIFKVFLFISYMHVTQDFNFCKKECSFYRLMYKSKDGHLKRVMCTFLEMRFLREWKNLLSSLQNNRQFGIWKENLYRIWTKSRLYENLETSSYANWIINKIWGLYIGIRKKVLICKCILI